LTYNTLLVNDLGPFEEQNEAWNSGAIVIKQYGAKIIALSREQSIRGLRHLQNRPDLIICDDVEDMESTKTTENRNANYEWFSSEVMPCGDEKTQIVYVGNLVNEDCIIERLRIGIEENRIDGLFLRVPIMENEKPTWPERFPNLKAIEKVKRTIPSESAWYREFMLRIVDDETRLIRREQIHYYDELPKDTPCRLLVLGTDLAVSLGSTADFSTIVAIAVYYSGTKRKLFILPGVINARMLFYPTINCIISKAKTLSRIRETEVVVEDVAFQRTYIEVLRKNGCRARTVPLKGLNKRERLEIPASLVVMGEIMFSKFGTEKLIEQLVNFGLSEHDDLVDAFSLGVNYAIKKTGDHNIGVTSSDGPYIGIFGERIDPVAIEKENELEEKMRNEYEEYRVVHEKHLRGQGLTDNDIYNIFP
jgi:phage terminase large subunit-like protein